MSGPRSRSYDSRFARIAIPIAFAFGVLAVWEAYVAASGVPESSLPSPTAIAVAGWEQRDLLWDNLWPTVAEIAIGLTAAIVVGIVLAVLIRSSPLAERALYPWLVASQMIPIVAIAPILVIWTGFDLRPKVIVIALVAFFPIAVAMIDGLRAADPGLLRLLRTMGATPAQRLRFAQVPASLPFLFSGLKIASALAVIGAVFAEWVGSSAGLGYLILVFNNATETAAMFAAVALLAAVGLILFGLVLAAERLILPWYHADR